MSQTLVEGKGQGRRLLGSPPNSDLGDWIARQQDGVKPGEEAAEDRLTAAPKLHKRLVALREAEPPFDIVVRWGPIAQHPIGRELDINAGVRLNSPRSLDQDRPGGILRAKPNLHWKKDRGGNRPATRRGFPGYGRVPSSSASGSMTCIRQRPSNAPRANRRKANRHDHGQ